MRSGKSHTWDKVEEIYFIIARHLCTGLLFPLLWIRNGFNADPDRDPAFCLNADPDLDPNPGSQINAGPYGSGSYKTYLPF
jgi:hypothetical protein